MLAQSTSTFTEGARQMKRSKFTTTKATRTSPAVRKTADETKSGRKWLIHLPPTDGTATTSAMSRTRLRSATARTPASSTSENKIDTISSPPLTSSRNGKRKKSNARAISSSTVEKRRIPNFGTGFGDSFAGRVSFIQLHSSRYRSRYRVVIVPQRSRALHNECWSMSPATFCLFYKTGLLDGFGGPGGR